MGKDMKYLDVAEDNAAKAATESGTYSGSYGDKIDTAINSWLSNRGFDYNTSNDKDYQKYVEQYKDNTQTGAQLSRQTAAQLANGYEPSYADIVAGEVANKQMENVSDAVPTYKQMAQLDYNAEQNRLANAGNIYSQLDSTEYSRNRDLTQDYKNQLNTLYNRYVADRQSNLQLNELNNNIYETKLNAEQNRIEDERNAENSRYIYNTQSADSKAQIAQAEEENDRKIQYNKSQDAYNNWLARVSEMQKADENKGKTRNAEAVFAAMGVTENDFKEDGDKYDEKGINNYVTYSKAYIDGALEAGRINSDERDYLYNKIGVTSDDEKYNNGIAESFINAYLKKEDKNGNVSYANEAFTKKQLEIGFDKGHISKDDVAYIAAKLGINI
ncbi:hypothetical protein H8R91_10790 [Ruminococcus sp. NSJ-71]|uniref:Uncharacterized protein n=1 Tax=Ruminococcus intestinalis TaxID=2763066 RepID=A0ABR7HNK4_9FIRM|nr:hypothetical protein [Ruminococcus intestinalis]MBC5728996.1 hypothetical protein [Ruminococcus intestinalis]